MTQFLFIRHTDHHFLHEGKIAGRLPGVHLSSLGQKQANELANCLSVLPIDCIYSSPLERACETAEPLAKRLEMKLEIAEEFNEVNIGDWTSKSLEELNTIPLWHRWNSFRSCTRAPNGETIVEVQKRILEKLLELQDRHRCIAVFSHGDVIRAALCHFLGLHLDFLLRLQVDPGSVSVVELHDRSAVVRVINASGNWRRLLGAAE